MKTIKVNDMTCMACYKKIQTELLKNQIVPNIDLLTHEVKVNEKDLNNAVLIIKNLGYNPEI